MVSFGFSDVIMFMMKTIDCSSV